MRPARVQFTIRGLMIVTAVVGVGLGINNATGGNPQLLIIDLAMLFVVFGPIILMLLAVFRSPETP